MPAVAGGTGFVGFGDYVNANQQGAQQLAQDASAGGPDLGKDQLDIANDTSTVEGQVAPWLQNAQAQAVAGDPNPADLNPTVTKNYTYSADANGPGGNQTQGETTVTTPSPYAGQTQGQADYNQWETANNPKGGAQDPNNPYGIQAGTASLAANPNQLAGYNTAEQALNQQLTDQQSIANENTWGGAFGALQAENKPDANGLYHNATGTGTGFDALLAQGAMSGGADAARASEAGDAGEQTALTTGIMNAATPLQNTPYAPPAALTNPGTGPGKNIPNVQKQPSPTAGTNYPGQGFSSPGSQNSRPVGNPNDPNDPNNINRTGTPGGTY